MEGREEAIVRRADEKKELKFTLLSLPSLIFIYIYIDRHHHAEYKKEDGYNASNLNRYFKCIPDLE